MQRWRSRLWERSVDVNQLQFAVAQLLNEAVASTEIVDILKAAGITTPDISIFSDEFLLEAQNMPRNNLALEALRKLLNGEITSRWRLSVVEADAVIF